MDFELRKYEPSWEKELSDKIMEQFPEKIEIHKTETRRIYAKADRTNIHDILKFLRDKLDFEHCANVIGVDYEDHMAVVYHIENYRHYSGEVIEIEVELPADDLHIPTACDIWGGANWNERETWELFGIVFDGHPKLERLLTPDNYQFFPFRKSYKLRGQE